MWERKGGWPSGPHSGFRADPRAALRIDGEINQIDRVPISQRYVASPLNAHAASSRRGRVEELLEGGLAGFCVVESLFLQNVEYRNTRKVADLIRDDKRRWVWCGDGCARYGRHHGTRQSRGGTRSAQNHGGSEDNGPGRGRGNDGRKAPRVAIITGASHSWSRSGTLTTRRGNWGAPRSQSNCGELSNHHGDGREDDPIGGSAQCTRRHSSVAARLSVECNECIHSSAAKATRAELGQDISCGQRDGKVPLRLLKQSRDSAADRDIVDGGLSS